MTDLEDPNERSRIIHESNQVRETLSNKYTKLFSSDESPLNYDVESMESVTTDKLESSMRHVSSNKGLGMKCLPDIVFKLLYSDLKKKT